MQGTTGCLGILKGTRVENLPSTKQEMLASDSQQLGFGTPARARPCAQNTRENFPSLQAAPCSLSTAEWGVLFPLVSLLTQLLY